MATRTRPLDPGDVEPLVALALRAWEPVFASLRRTLGDELFDRLRPDWRRDQEEAVRSVCRQENGMTVLVAEDDADHDDGGHNDGGHNDGGHRVVGFVGVVADHASGMGVIEILGVDPAAQGRGVGTLLTRLAHDALRAAGMRVAMVETGGDPGHAAARRTYERAGATLLPIARYFTPLDP